MKKQSKKIKKTKINKRVTRFTFPRVPEYPKNALKNQPVMTRLKVNTRYFLGKYNLPFGWKLPLYNIVIFFPNNEITTCAVPQNPDGTFSVGSRIFSIKENDIHYDKGDSYIFFNYNDAVPLEVKPSKITYQGQDSTILKGVMENKLVLDFLQETPLVDPAILKYGIIALVVICVAILLIVANGFDMINISEMFGKIGG